ncbi:MAG: hypothetical protein AAGD01_09220 [Acidobacteriota bacterium]
MIQSSKPQQSLASRRIFTPLIAASSLALLGLGALFPGPAAESEAAAVPASGQWRGELPSSEASQLSWWSSNDGGEAHSTALAAEQQILSSAELEDGWLLLGQQGQDLALWRLPEGAQAQIHAITGGDEEERSRWQAQWDGAWKLEPPALSRAGLMRLQPQAVSHRGELLGLAWLEGPEMRSLEVRWSSWLGEAEGWGPVITVAKAAEGTQTALSAAVDSSGAPLLAWSAFDGQDDEVLWSRREQGASDEVRWTSPQPAFEDNQVPDIAPRLSVDGRLLAWSRFDEGVGGYRLHVARFEGEGFVNLGPVAGSGSVLPTFERPLSAGSLEESEIQRRGESESYLLYRSVAASGWELARIASDGRVLARALAATSNRERSRRPVVLEAGPEAVRFGWTAASVPETVKGKSAEALATALATSVLTTAVPWQSADPALGLRSDGAEDGGLR